MADLAEKCAIFGVYGRGLDVARLTFFGLYALQHRGQESSGIATAEGSTISVYKGMGLVSQVFTEDVMKNLSGHIAIGHNRYSTIGGSHLDHAQPILIEGTQPLHKGEHEHNPDRLKSIELSSTPGDSAITLAHNGNLPSTLALEGYLRTKGVDPSAFSDSRMMVEAIGIAMRESKTLEQAVQEIYPLMTGAFSILIMSKDELIALRDPCGIRPLSIGTLNGGYVFASETCALNPVGATHLRDVNPGEMVIVDERGMRSIQIVQGDQKLDIFEFIYFSRPDSVLLGQSVYTVRKNFGVELAKEVAIECDVIIPIPETSVPSAIGYSQERGVPFEMGLTKNRYIHRTFIQPEQHIRDQGVKAKLTPQKEVIAGKRVAVVDDSIVRGTTSRQIVAMLFESGAKEVHFLVSSPPVIFPDFYGIDTPKQHDLLAATRSIAEMREFLGATSLHFLSYRGMIRATGVPESKFSTSFFTGEYPIDIRERKAEIVAKRVCYTPFSEEYQA